MKVAVTGATGFIGTHLSAELARANIQVCAIRRNEDPSSALEHAEAVVHLAGRAHVFGRGAQAYMSYHQDNVVATRAMVEAAGKAGVRHFVFLSSLGAVARESPTIITDATVPNPQTPYGRSKLEAEGVVLEAAERFDLAVTILRPPAVYGAGMKGNPLRLLQLIRRGLPIPVPASTNRRSMMYVGNLAAAIRTAVQSRSTAPAGVPYRGTWLVSDCDDVSTAEFIRRMAHAAGRPARTIPVPYALASAAGRTGDVLSRVMSVPVNGSTIAALFGSLFVDGTGFNETFSFRPNFSFEEGIALSVQANAR